MKKITVLFTVSLLILSLTALQAATVLKLNLEKGKEYKVKTTNTQTMTMNMNGMQINTDVNSINAIKFVPESFETDFMLVRVTFDSIISNVNNPYRPMKINSNKPGNLKNPDNLMNNVFSTLAKNPLEVKLSYAGKVIEIINLKAVSDSVYKQLDSLPDASKAPLKQAVDGIMNLDMVKIWVESPINYLSGKPVNSGDKWESKYTMKPNGMELSITTNFKCKNIANNQADLTGDVIIESPENAVMNMGGMQMPFDMRGMGSTDISVDLNTGWVIKGKGKQKMQGSMTIQGNPAPMEIESKTEVEAVK